MGVYARMGYLQIVQTQIRCRKTICLNARKLREKWNNTNSPFKTIFQQTLIDNLSTSAVSALITQSNGESKSEQAAFTLIICLITVYIRVLSTTNFYPHKLDVNVANEPIMINRCPLTMIHVLGFRRWGADVGKQPFKLYSNHMRIKILKHNTTERTLQTRFY